MEGEAKLEELAAVYEKNLCSDSLDTLCGCIIYDC